VHSAGAYLNRVGKAVTGAVLSPSERQGLELCLLEDSKDYYQSSLVSFVDGLRSIKVGFYSWATVKLYYSVFYALRARLALSGDCIFYEGTKPRFVNTSAGSSVLKLKGNTHKCVLDRFAEAYPYDLFVSQDIASIPPLDWFMERREEVNYNLPRFSEPDPSLYMTYASSTDLRQMLSSYLNDAIYMHDPDHALVAFPFCLLVDLRLRLLNKGLRPLNQSELEFLTGHMRDNAGTITAASSLLV
jgi:hypothetical protein